MNKPFLLLSILLLVSSVFSNAQNLVVELKTDKYSSETSWKLFDSEKNLIQSKTEFADDSVQFDTIALDASLCYFWTLYDEYGDGFSNVSTEGYYKLWFDGELIAQSKEANFGDSISEYGLGAGCVPFDLSIETLLVNQVQTFDPFAFVAVVTNLGTDTIRSVTAEYSINQQGGNAVSIQNILLPTGVTDTLTFMPYHQFDAEGNYELEFAIATINGENDQKPENSQVQKSITVKKGYLKRPMLELFTSSTCGPCVYGNKTVDATLDELSTLQYSLIKYQMNWPGSGDPYYTAEGGQMRNLYGVTGVPSLYVNTQKHTAGEFTPDVMSPFLEQISPFSLTISGEVIGDSVFVQGTVTGFENSASELYLRLALVEKITYNNVATNGEKEFHNVFMKFISSVEGDTLGLFEAGKELNFSYAENISGTNIEEFSDLRLSGYVFTQNSYSIVQSAMVDLPFTPLMPTIEFSIDDLVTGVDTLPQVEITSSKALKNLDGTAIGNPATKIQLFETATEEEAEYTVELSEDEKTILVKTTNYLKSSTNYTLVLDSVMSNEGVVLSKQQISFTTMGALSVDEQLNVAGLIYPNPVKEVLRIDLAGELNYQLLSVRGEILMQGSLFNVNKEINLNKLSRGVYLLKLSSNGAATCVKVIKE